MKPIRVWWPTGPEPGNFGDMLTPVLLRHFGYDPIWVGVEHAELLCTGSIARLAQPGQMILGSGVMRRQDRPSPEATYLAVRGPKTREIVIQAGGSCPEIFGDPGLLLPLVYDPATSKKHDLGIVPHYVDYTWAVTALKGHHIISPLRPDPRNVARDILECREVLSSSLHGIIVAHAYGIPAAWVRFSNRLNGDGTKFADYAASVGVELVPYESVEEAVPVLPEPFDTGPLEEAFRCL